MVTKFNFDFMSKKKIFFTIPIVIVLLGVLFYFINGGFNEDVEFVGGTEINMNIGQEFKNDDIAAIFKEQLGKDPSSVQVTGDTKQEVVIKSTALLSEEGQKLIGAICEKYGLVQSTALLSNNNISPTVGRELALNAFWAVVIAAILILMYVTVRFEFLSGVVVVIAAIHDVLLMLAFYTILQIPFNSTAIAAILTIIGYSINDTIVVFDRIRENSKKRGKNERFTEMVNRSINETFLRCINTSATTVFTIATLYVFGVTSIKDFALPLLVGVISGAYSSIAIAAPLWVMWKDKAHDKYNTPKKKVKTA